MTTQTQTTTLFSPFNLGGLTLKNRVVMPPLTRARAGEERMPNSLMAEYYAQRASVGLVVRQASVGLSIIREKKISFVPESYALPTLRS